MKVITMHEYVVSRSMFFPVGQFRRVK